MKNMKNTIIAALVITGVLFFFLLRHFSFEQVCAIGALMSAVVYGILQTLPKGTQTDVKKKKKHKAPQAQTQQAVRREIIEMNGKRYIEFIEN